MADIFLSYAREDIAAAGKLAALLESNGLSVWWDRRLVAGDEIADVIERALDEAKAAVVLWSPQSVNSRWVRGEAETAAEANKLIPVRIADCTLPLNFRGLHTPDVYKSKQQLDELANLLSSKLLPDRKAASPQSRRIALSGASEARFLDDLQSVLTDPSPSFAAQLQREWDLSKRLPWGYWGGGILAYLLCIRVVSAVFDLDFNTSNVIVGAAFLIIYFLYRRHRLSRSQ